MIYYDSTRGTEKGLTASQAILKGLANDGGLFVPQQIPKFDFKLRSLVGKPYQELAWQVMKLFLTDYTEEELRECIDSAYDDKFDTPEIAPLVYADGAYYLELFHGATIAFKDMALSILPHLMTKAAQKNGVKDKIIILTATSGDTGKAAMAGFADVAGTGIVVFYPKGGVSRIQELQMVTQKGSNVDAIAIHGNFDDAQTGVKEIFGDAEFAAELKKRNIILSSANSINIGRLVPQVAYYVYAYVKLLENGKITDGEKINICVPTGNFGNILAAYYAKLMGLPVEKLICASNDNRVLTDFFETGRYDKNRPFILTDSPSMDILVSSNLERLIYMSCGFDAKKNTELMKALKTGGVYETTDEMRQYMADFVGGAATGDETAARIRELYDNNGYVIDTHTAVASAVYKKYREESGDTRTTVIASTASPYKFGRAVVGAVTGTKCTLDDFAMISELQRISKTPVPAAIREIEGAPELHTGECDICDMRAAVLKAVAAFA